MKKNFLYKSFVLSLLCTSITLYVSPMMRRRAQSRPADQLVQALNLLKGKLLILAKALTKSPALFRRASEQPSVAHTQRIDIKSPRAVVQLRLSDVSADVQRVQNNFTSKLPALSRGSTLIAPLINGKLQRGVDLAEMYEKYLKQASVREMELKLHAFDYTAQTYEWEFKNPASLGASAIIIQMPALQQAIVQRLTGIDTSYKGFYTQEMCGWYTLYFAQVFEQTELGSPDRLERLNRRSEFERMLEPSKEKLKASKIHNLDCSEVFAEIKSKRMECTIVDDLLSNIALAPPGTYGDTPKLTFDGKYPIINEALFEIYEGFFGEEYVTALKKHIKEFKTGRKNKLVIILAFSTLQGGHWITVCVERDCGTLVFTVADSYNEDHRMLPEILCWYRYLTKP
jgi:hypothetical protein